MTSAPWIVGRYEVHEAIAAGGMGSVHLARQRGDAGFTRLVVVKRMHGYVGEEPGWASSMLDEARLGSRVRHPNVVAALDLVAHERELLVVMEYVHGESFASLLRAAAKRGEDLPVPVVGAIASDLLRGLHAVHVAESETGELLGLVHRDVSPHNVMVGVEGIARVTDLGIAKPTERGDDHTKTGQIKGKLAYLAPELAGGDAATRASDVFCAGIVLWEGLTGEPLFGGGAEVDVFRRVVACDVPPPSSRRSDLSAEIDAVCLRALARDPRDRPSALELAEQVDRLLNPARPAQVADWVARLAGDTLAKRAALIKRVEARPPIDAEPQLPEPAVVAVSDSAAHDVRVAAPAPRPRAAWPMALGIGGVAAVGVAGALLFLPASAPKASPPPPASEVTPTASVSSEPQSPVVAASVPPPTPAATVDKVEKPRPKPSVDPCSPPYVVQPDGRKKFKTWCL